MDVDPIHESPHILINSVFCLMEENLTFLHLSPVKTNEKNQQTLLRRLEQN